MNLGPQKAGLTSCRKHDQFFPSDEACPWCAPTHSPVDTSGTTMPFWECKACLYDCNYRTDLLCYYCGAKP